jgi:serine/threonine-protein kinase
MFLREAELASQIHHPHVCRVISFGRRNGVAYLAMEYLRGRSLASISQRLQPIQRPARHAALVARLLADACEGLQAIHEHGRELVPPLRVVHRDISPENLFLTEQGFVKIIDFGLAKVETARDKTQPGIVKGKLSYMAPELFSGEVATPRSDLWSLGVVAWELLTERRLFRDKTDLGTVTKVQKMPIARPSSIVPGLPRALDKIVLRALERDPAKRYGSAAEFAEALWAYLARGKVVQHSELAAWLREANREPVKTGPETVISRSFMRWSSRTVRRSTLAAVGVALALAVSVFHADRGRLPTSWAATESAQQRR